MKCIQPKNGMYLTSEDFPQWHDEFANLLPEREEKTTELRVKTVTFVVTEECSLRCTYCYQHKKRSRRMTKDVALKAVDFLLEGDRLNGYINVKESQGVIFEFIGGEPLLEIDLIDEIVDYFKFKAFSLNHPWATNYMVNLSSNGVLYNDPRVQRFLEKNKGRVFIGISIDGDKVLHDTCRLFPDGTGSYDVVEKAVENAVENWGLTQSKVTIAPENLPYLTRALKHLWHMGLFGIHANTVYEEGWNLCHAQMFYKKLKEVANYLLTNENYRRYQTSLFEEHIGHPLPPEDCKNYCGGNGLMLAIGTDGKCYPCIRYMKYCMSTDREERDIGDICEGIHSQEEDPWLKDLCAIDMITQSNNECKSCQIASGCGVCPGYQYDMFGDPNVRATYICVMHKARVLANVYYWNNIYRDLGLEKRYSLDLPKNVALDIITEEEFDSLKILSERKE